MAISTPHRCRLEFANGAKMSECLFAADKSDDDGVAGGPLHKAQL